MVVFVQSYSLWLILLAISRVMSAERIVFYHPNPLGEDLAARQDVRKKLIVGLMRAMNPGAQIEEIDREGLYRLGLYQNNFESDRYVEKGFLKVSKSASFRIMRAVLDQSAIEWFYKLRLLDGVRERTAFMRAIPQVLGCSLAGTVIPACGDRFGLDRDFISDEDYSRMVPILIRVSHRWRTLLGMASRAVLLWNPVVLALVPIAFICALLIRHGMALRSVSVRADVVMPLAWGFAESGLVRGARRLDNSYLVGQGLDLNRFAFYFADWRYSAEEETRQKLVMERQGIRYFDPRTFVPSAGYLREVGTFYWHLLLGLTRRPRVILDDPWIVKITAALLYHYLRELLLVHSVDFKVLLEYQDYLAPHVVRTLVANQRGRLTVGIHHNAPDGPYGFPHLRYAYINRYCVWGEEFMRLYSPYWERLDTRLIGAPGVDSIVTAQNGKCRRELDQAYQERYGGGRPLVLVQFPGLSTLNVKHRALALIEGLGRLKELSFEFQVICRFRAIEHVQVFRNLGLDQVMTRDPRIAIDMADLSTFEWVALSDVVIANGISAGMVEAVAAGKPCFSFDHQLLAEIIYGRYGSDLILRTADDLVRVFRHMKDGFRGWDCRSDQLAKAYCYFADGKNLARYRQVILDAIADVEAGRAARTGWTSKSLEGASL